MSNLIPKTVEEMWISEGMPEMTEMLAQLLLRDDVLAWFTVLAADRNPNPVDAAKCALLIGYAIGKNAI